MVGSAVSLLTSGQKHWGKFSAAQKISLLGPGSLLDGTRGEAFPSVEELLRAEIRVPLVRYTAFRSSAPKRRQPAWFPSFDAGDSGRNVRGGGRLRRAAGTALVRGLLSTAVVTSATVAARRTRLRVVTYNIHKGIGGVDRKYRPDRIVEVLAKYVADFVLLQEVDEGVPRSRMERQVDVIGDALGLPYRAYFPNVQLRRGHYGNAFLSRFPLDHKENIDLTVPLKKRRGALHARTTLRTGRTKERVWFFNLHLGLAEFERRAQIRRLLAWRRRHHPPGEATTVIAGDFNDVWGRLGSTLLEPEGFSGTARLRTFPAAAALRPLDRLFVSGRLRIESVRTGASSLERRASDHLPLVVDLVR